MKDAVRRTVGWSALVLLLVAMCVHYGAVADVEGHDRTQVDHRKLAAYEAHLGEQLYFWATVVEDTETGMVARSQGHRLEITGTDTTVRRGDAIQVLGTIQPGGTVLAERVVVSSQSHLRYLYGISALGALVTALLFCRRWKIDWESITVAPRGDDRA